MEDQHNHSIRNEIADLNQMILEMQLEGLITEISKNCYVRNDLEI